MAGPAPRPVHPARALLLAAALLAATAGCVYLPRGVIKDATGSLGNLVVVNRQIPVNAIGLPDCGLEVAETRGGEFQFSSSAYLLVQMKLRNGSPQTISSLEVDVRGYNLAGNEASREAGRIEKGVGMGRTEKAAWSSRLATRNEVARADLRVTAVFLPDGSLCTTDGGPPPPPSWSEPPPPPSWREPPPPAGEETEPLGEPEPL